MDSEHLKVRGIAGGGNTRVSLRVHTAPGSQRSLCTVIPQGPSVGKERKSATLSRLPGRKLEKGW